MTITPESKVGQIATEHPLATRVFARHGIDYCCGGGVALSKACEKRSLDVTELVAEIERELAAPVEDEVRWDRASLKDLIEHILTTYHRPLDEELPRLEAMARKVDSVHGERHPDLLPAVLSTYLELKAELDQHMMKEEQVLFPLILDGRGALAAAPVSVMEQEHEHAGAALSRLRELTDGYQAPEHACNTWRALWHGLGALEEDLHRHIHLENNVLFPRALADAG